MADISQIRNGSPLNLGAQLALTAKLSVPAIVAQLSTIIMQYIDASMVGRLGADDSASIGLMNSSLWMFWGICGNITTGFAVQVAHRLGANDPSGARAVLRQSILSCLLLSLGVMAIGLSIAGALPGWLGGAENIRHGSTVYFSVFVAALPLLTMNYLGSAMLRSAGNMKVPALFNIGMCLVDIVLNFFLIFPSRVISLGGMELHVPGADLGVLGAALGTAGAECLCAVAVMTYLCRREKELAIWKIGREGGYRLRKNVAVKAAKISGPMVFEHIVFCGAQIMITSVVAPLGVVAIAANAFAVTAESLCYMPGFGIGEAATTLIGQCYGAKRFALLKRFGYLTVWTGIAVMTVMAFVMYAAAPLMMGILSPVEAIRDLGTEVLRIEAWAEPMYAASIVAYGVFIGVGDTLLPAAMNFGSIWLVRLPLAALMAPTMGLQGVWIAMMIELIFRGVIFLWRLYSGRWLKHARNRDRGPLPTFEEAQ